MKPFIKWIEGLLLLLLSLQNLQAQSDTLCNPNENKKIFGELYFNYGSANNVYSQFNRSTFIVGQPLVSPQNMLSQNAQAGFGVYSPWYLPPQPPILVATQGDFKDRIKISWNVNPLSPASTGFVLYRDGSFLADLGENVRDYLDFNTQAGEYYEYSIEAKNVFGVGSRSKTVGFVNPNGVVSGKIETNSGNPVPGVEVRLTPLTGNSMAFDGVNDELCVTYHDELPTDKFTVSAYVKLGDINNEGAIIDWGSSLNKNWWITTTPSGEPKGYIFHIGNGAGSDSLKYYLPNLPTNPENVNNWHQITMVYNGSALSVMVDGEFIGTKPASIVREKNYLNIGSKIGNDGFFKGKIDDIRVYNRPLTQTEVNSTKNRSVSKTESGLVSYWKMDEGIGVKVFDNTTIPTNANVYGATFSADKPEVYSAGITDVTGYYVIDGINYSQNEGFRATPNKNFEYNSALEFNAADKSYGNLTDFDMPDTSTVEVLFYPFDLKSRQTVLSKGNLYEVYLDNGKLFLNLNGTTTDLGIITAKYYHLAVALDNSAGSAKVYLEGELKETVSFGGTSNWNNGSPWLLATNSSDAGTGNFYTGLVDKFLIYKTLLPQNIIQEHFVVGIPQDSTTALLYSHFDLNEGSDTKVYDYAAINFGASLPREGNILKASWSNNARRKETKPHEFEPNVRVVNLNTSNTAIGNIDFRDVSTVNVSGYIRFANTFCFEEDIEIKVNGQPHFPPIFTDKDGKWSADFEPGKTLKLTAEYKDHLFSPSFYEIRKIQAPKAGVVFLDNTKRTIRGQVAGNDICRKSIIPEGSRVVVKVATLDGCFEKTDTLRNPDGKFVFSDLPARAFRVSIVEHSNSIIYNYFQQKGGLEVDLRDITADTTDFIYVAPPNVEISKPLANKCNIPLMNQTSLYKTTIKVFETYDGGNCYLPGANLSITNAIADADPFEAVMTNGKYEYEYKAGNPNLLAPHKKLMQVVAEVNGVTTQDTITAVVLGKKARAATFTSKSPEFPFLVLRDPPGDQSTATLEKNVTNCFNMSINGSYGQSFENSLTLSAGSEVTTSVGVGAETELTIERTADFGVTSSFGYKVGANATFQTCLTNTEAYSTSTDLQGDAGDLYAGFAINFTYGVSDVLKYDDLSCQFKKEQDVNVSPKDFATTYIYSDFQIRNDVIPSLKALGKDADAKNWENILKENKELKSKATFEKNLSFDAGVSFSSTTTSEYSGGASLSFEVEGSQEFAVEQGIEINGLGLSKGFKTNMSFSLATETGYEGSNSKTVSYNLADDDLGDNFTVNVKKDDKYGTPVFELVSGESSCPHETNTRPRSEPSLTSIDGLTKINVPSNTSAVYQIELGNLSPTEEEMEYALQLVTGTNPSGAIVKVDGQPLTQPVRYSIPYGETVTVTVTLDKGPISYDYEDIEIKMFSECESNDSLFSRSLSLNASFIEPCSPVDISFPLQGFVITPAAENILSITLNEYNKNDDDLEVIRLQYRPIAGDGSWINISETLKDELGEVFTIKQWDTQLLKDGPYEIRAVAECNNPNLASGISTIVQGEVARNPPVLVGVPEPGDGTWDPGDEISITFNEPINCDKVVQADILANNTIGLYDATTNALVDATIACVGNKIIIVPNINPVFFENRTFRVEISGKDYDDAMIAENPNHQRAAIRDKAGNMIPKTIKWEFAVNQNNLEWVGTDIIETNEVLKPFSVKRQLRNRGGSIASFRMESVPSWLTVSPATGTLNPGQVADVTFTFQQDLLIGDYLDTLNLVGSKGAEPLSIDYRVRCPQPKYEVVNPEQYQGTMNMVVDLSIFSVHSTDPSDVIVAKIGGQIRGVGKVAYFKNIPADKQRWLTFLTIYGNPTDEDKPIEFSIWDGDKCNEYVEILENYTYNDGSLNGSPLVPASIQVLNLVKKCIPLNKGFNWVSFNLDLGADRNTVANVLGTLKNKAGAYIKTDNSFAEYFTGYGWDASDTLIYPTKRYMVFVTEKDTVCLKGSPYKSSEYPIAIKNSWNWIGYVPSTGMTVTQALKGLTPLNGDIIKSQTLFAQFVAGVGWIGNLSFLEPLKGYLLKIGNAGTLIYPSSTVSGNVTSSKGNSIFEAPSINALNAQTLLEPPMAFNFTQFEQTMNLIGKINGMTVTADDELRAYIDGKLVGINKPISNKKEQLFFQTIYSNDEQKVEFKLYKADRLKEYDLDKNVVFKAETLAGMVQSPIEFNIINAINPEVTIAIEDVIIKQPDLTFPTVSIPGSISQSNANCTSFVVSTILPVGTETKPECSAVTQEGNMSTVIRVRFNERSSFVSDNDVLTFVNPSTNAVLGCASFNTTNKLFYSTIYGPTGSGTFPIDVKYYSNTMKKTFTLKSAITYQFNSKLGNGPNPIELDFSPLSVTVNNGVVTAVLRDTSFVGDYGVNAFALNCTGYNDGQATYTYRRIRSNDCSYSFATPSSNTPICKGSTLSLKANKGTSYLWTGPNGFSSTLQNPEIPSVGTAAAGIYTVTVTSYRCAITATTSVIVNALTMTATSNTPVCEKGTLNLSSSGGTSYSWNGPNGFISTEQNPTITDVGLTSAGTYSVKITSNGCSDSLTTEVAIKPLPVISLAPSINVCLNSTLKLTSSGGTTYLWSGPKSFSSTLQNPEIANADSSIAGLYTLTATTNGCTSTANITVNVIPLPVIPTISGISETCAGTKITLTASSASGGVITWSDNTVGSNLEITPTSNTSYTVSAMVNNCTSTSAPFEIKVNPLFTSPVITADNLEICKGNSAILSATCPVGSVFRWLPAAPVSGQTLALSNTNTRVVSEPGTYTGICEPPTGCPSAKVNIVITQRANCNTQSFITITPAKPVICPNKAVTLTATGCSGTISWLGGSTTLIGQTATVNPTATTTYLVQCSTGGTGTVIVEVATANVIVNSNITTGSETVKATNTIESDKKVGSANFTPAPSVNYEAGNAILLKPGFSTEKYSVFKAEIKKCN
jgi:Concanavalin A-like lectin/glucanases superfamily